MSKELEALQRIKDDHEAAYIGNLDGETFLDEHPDVLSDYDTVEKRLQAFDIIEEKEVNIQYFKSALEMGYGYELCEEECQDNSPFEEFPPYKHSMTEDEFNLLKEVLQEK